MKRNRFAEDTPMTLPSSGLPDSLRRCKQILQSFQIQRSIYHSPSTCSNATEHHATVAFKIPHRLKKIYLQNFLSQHRRSLSFSTSTPIANRQPPNLPFLLSLLPLTFQPQTSLHHHQNDGLYFPEDCRR
jgi:hypothetical protein